MVLPAVVKTPPRSIELEQLVTEEIPSREAIPPFTNQLTETIARHLILHSFADFSKQGLSVMGYGIPIPWVASDIYAPDNPSSFNLSPQEIIKTVGKGIIVNAFGDGFSQALRSINCGVIHASEDGRYLSWKRFLG